MNSCEKSIFNNAMLLKSNGGKRDVLFNSEGILNACWLTGAARDPLSPQ